MKTKKRKVSISSLRRKADKLWSIKVRGLHDNKCSVCQRSEYLNAHHIDARTNLILRWDIKNGIALCPLCHKFGKNSAHKSTIWFYEWLKEKKPEVVDYISQYRNGSIKITKEYLEEIIKKLSDVPF